MHHEEVSDMNDICRQPGIERNTSGGMRIMSRRARVCARRGNTLVLVAAVLALLAIIATAYVTRTQSQRMVSVAQQQASMRGENVEHIAESLAEHIAMSLFVHPIDTTDPAMWDGDGFPTLPASSNYPRLKPRNNAARYGIDQQWLDPENDGEFNLYTFGYNHAPYHTVPFTNWPTPQALHNNNNYPEFSGDPGWELAVEMLPPGPGNPGNPFDDTVPIPGIDNLAHAFESNPMGNPGFGDLRWLADTEPVRWFPPGSDYEAFSHWRKLTNIATPNNNWRVIGDISDIDRTIITDLTIPIEQWPAFFRPNRQIQEASVTGDTSIAFLHQFGMANGFLRQWANWLGFQYNAATDRFEEPASSPMWKYLMAYGNQAHNEVQAMPSNFLRLSNLQAFGNKHTWRIGGVAQDRPESEFIRGTARHSIGRVLADTTGDGFTDAFWFDPGLPPQNGIRQIVAVRIEDNSSRLNVNVATRFHRNDFDFDGFDAGTTKTRGDTPADLALVGQLRRMGVDLNQQDINFGNHWNVGLFDNPANWQFLFSDGLATPMGPWGYNYGTASATDLWARHLRAIGLTDWNPNAPPFFKLVERFERLDYWRRSARHGLANQPTTLLDDYNNWWNNRQFTPFSLADDLVLRLYHGNNHSWHLSAFEHSAQVFNRPGLLRSARTPHRHEQSEYMDQLNNRQLVLDNRRMLTMHSGARNDQLPPWLWWENRYAPGWNFEHVKICAEPNDEPGIDRVRAAMPVMARNVIFNLCDAGDTFEANAAFRRFLAQSRQKLDLREYEDRFYQDYFVGSDDLLQPDYYLSDISNLIEHVGRLNLRDRLAPTLMMALYDGPMVLDSWEMALPGHVFTSYFGDVVVPYPLALDALETSDPRHYLNPSGNLNNTRRLAASFAANILAERGNDRVYLADRVLLPEFSYVPDVIFAPGDTPPVNVVYERGKLEPRDPNGGAPPLDESLVGHIALDYQPFLIEAVIAHLHHGIFLMEGQYADFEQGYYHCKPRNATMIMVEIANPFDVPIPLDGFRINVFGKPVNLTGLNHWLAPHESRVYYSIPEDGGDEITVDVDQWRALFGLDGDNAFDVIDLLGADAEWPHTRQELEEAIKDLEDDQDLVDAAKFSRAIEIERWNHTTSAGDDVWYVVDRIDMTSPELEATAHHQITAMTADDEPPFDPDDPLANRPTWYYDVNIVKDSCDPDLWPPVGQPVSYPEPLSHALQWVRVARAWQMEPVLDPAAEYDPELSYFDPANQRNPRYVFGTRRVEVLENTGTFTEPIYHRRLADEEQYYRHWAVIFDQDDLADWAGTDPADLPEEFRLMPRPRFGARIKGFELGTLTPGADDAFTFRVNDADGRFHFPMRMNLKRLPLAYNFLGDEPWDDENPGFEQIGELLNVWLFGHEIEFDPDLGPDEFGWYRRTRTTFAEFMQDVELQALFDWREEDPSLPDNDPQIVNCWQRMLDGELLRPDPDDFLADPDEYEQVKALFDTCMAWLRESDAHRVNRLRTRPWQIDLQVENPDDARTRKVGALLNRPKTPGELIAEGLVDDALLDPDDLDYLWSRYRTDPRHASPALPAGVCVLDAFVCDGPGAVWRERDSSATREWFDFWNEDLTDMQVQRRQRHNANDFRGVLTPGMININTATPEVLRALPHTTRLVHEDWSLENNPWNRTAWAIQRYRDRLGAPVWANSAQFPNEWGPAYAHRGRNVRVRDPDTGDVVPFFGSRDDFFDLNTEGFVPGMRGERGMASIGELTLLTQEGREGMVDYVEPIPGSDRLAYEFRYDETFANPADGAFVLHRNSNWRADYPTMPARTRYLTDRMSDPDEAGVIEYADIHPSLAYLFPDEDAPGWLDTDEPLPSWYQSRFPSSARLSTDVRDRVEQAFFQYWDDLGIDDAVWPEVAEDAREANLLFSGVSNIVTTRSDVFTVYFRVRSFRQNPSTGVWDATDLENIIDDTRYVMLVDRSEVNRPGDRPKILYMERIID